MDNPLQNRGVKNLISLFEQKPKAGKQGSTTEKTADVIADNSLRKTKQIEPNSLKNKPITPKNSEKQEKTGAEKTLQKVNFSTKQNFFENLARKAPAKMTVSHEKIKDNSAKTDPKVKAKKELFENKAKTANDIKPIVKTDRHLSNEINLLKRFPANSSLFRAKVVDLQKKLMVMQLKAEDNTESVKSLKEQLDAQVKENESLKQEVDDLQSMVKPLSSLNLPIAKGDNFDTLTSKLLTKYRGTDQDIPGPDKEQGKLAILKRIVVSANEGYPTEVIEACEKIFHQNTGKPSAPVKLNVTQEGNRYKIMPYTERGKLLVEIKEIGKGAFASGSFKKIKNSAIYGEANTFKKFVTAKPKEKKSADKDTEKTGEGHTVAPSDTEETEAASSEDKDPSNTIVKHNDSSDKSESPNETDDSSSGSFVVNSTSETDDSSSDSFVVNIDEKAKPDAQAYEADAQAYIMKRMKGEGSVSSYTSNMPINRMNLQLLEQEKKRIDNELKTKPNDTELTGRLEQVEKKIIQRNSDIESIMQIKEPTEKEEYEHEIQMHKIFKGEGVQSIHKVVSLQDGRKVMIQKKAGYVTKDGTAINDLKSFKNLMAENKLDDEEIKVYYQSIYDSLKGLQSIHEKGFIHRDMKSENVLVSSEGRGLVSDFGTAVPEKDPKLFIKTGTPSHLPPEAINWTESEMWSEITNKWDVWSVGIMLTDLGLEGKEALDHPIFLDQKGGQQNMRGINNIFTVLSALDTPSGQKNYTERLKQFKESNPNNPLVDLIIDCSQIDPDDRPTMTEVKERFKEILEEHGISVE